MQKNYLLLCKKNVSDCIHNLVFQNSMTSVKTTGAGSGRKCNDYIAIQMLIREYELCTVNILLGVLCSLSSGCSITTRVHRIN